MERQVNFHHLKVFHAVARRESFSRASEDLDISQPAVSLQVRALERWLGVPLLERQGRGVRLTDAGRLAYDYSSRIFALADEMQGAMADLKGLRRGRLVVGASTTIGEYLLPQAMGAFKARYPDIELRLEVANTARIVERLLRHELHLGFVGELVKDPKLAVEPVASDRIVIVAGARHPLARRSPAPVQALASEPFVMREEGSATRHTAEAALARAGVTPKVVMELGSNEAVKNAVAAGLGVSALSAHAVRTDVAAGRLRVVPVREFRCRRQFYLVSHKDRPLGPAHRAFIDVVKRSQRRTRAA